MCEAIHDGFVLGLRQLAVCAAVSLFPLLCGGCGGGNTSSVSGKVTLDGQPLANAQVLFTPEGEGGASFGETDSNGNYSLTHSSGGKGAVTGNHLVSIDELVQEDEEASEPEVDSSKPRAKPKTAPPRKSRLPVRYNQQSELRKEVKAGTNQIDFELTSN